MTKWKKIAIGVLATLSVLVVVFVGGMIYIFNGMCGSHLYKSVLSPSGKYKAVIYQFDCGAMTSFSTQISILSASEELEAEKGNIFTSDGHPENVAPEVTWVSESHLNIHKRASANVYNQETSWGWPWNKIEITYN